MLKYILSAAAISLMAVAPASAMPAAPAGLVQAVDGTGVVEKVQRHGRRDSERWDRRHSRRDSSRFRAGERLREPPRGYRRYSSRPSYWRDRNCVMAGPVWFCP